MRRGTPMAPEDAARLHMDLPQNPMVITAAILLERPLEREALVSLLEERVVVHHRRFRQRVVEPRLGVAAPRWEDDPTFDVRLHVDRIALPAPRDDRAFEELLGDLASTPLALARPLWRVIHVEGVAGEGAALIVRVHHAIADGGALLAVLAGLSDEGHVQSVPVAPPAPRRKQARRGRRILGGVVTASRLALRRSDPATMLRKPLGLRKHVAFSPPLLLSEVREQAQSTGASVTELLLASVAGTLGRHFPPPAGTHEVHALVPVPLAPDSPDAGNHYASIFVPLPVSVTDPTERVHRVQAETRALRAKGSAAGAHLAGAAGAATAAIERHGVELFSRRASVTVSSVRGPAARVHVGGVLAKGLVVWAPSPGSIALGITLVSYGGSVRVGVVGDARLVADPHAIAVDVASRLAAPSVSPFRG